MANVFYHFILLNSSTSPRMYQSEYRAWEIASYSDFGGINGDITLETEYDSTNIAGGTYTVSGELSAYPNQVTYGGGTYSVTIEFIDIIDNYDYINAASIVNVDVGPVMEGSNTHHIYSDATISTSVGTYSNAAAIVRVRFYNSNTDCTAYYAGVGDYVRIVAASPSYTGISITPASQNLYLDFQKDLTFSITPIGSSTIPSASDIQLDVDRGIFNRSDASVYYNNGIVHVKTGGLSHTLVGTSTEIYVSLKNNTSISDSATINFINHYGVTGATDWEVDISETGRTLVDYHVTCEDDDHSNASVSLTFDFQYASVNHAAEEYITNILHSTVNNYISSHISMTQTGSSTIRVVGINVTSFDSQLIELMEDSGSCEFDIRGKCAEDDSTHYFGSYLVYFSRPAVTPITYITTKAGSGNYITCNYGVYINPGAELLISPADFSDSDLGYGGEDDYFDVSPGSVVADARIIDVAYNIQDSSANTVYSIILYSKSSPNISSTVTGKWHIYDSILVNIDGDTSNTAEIVLNPGEELEFSIETSLIYGGTYDSQYITWDYTSGGSLITLTKEGVNNSGDVDFTVKANNTAGTAVITFYGKIGTNTEKSYCSATLTVDIAETAIDITTIKKHTPEEGEDIYLTKGESYDVIVGILPLDATESISNSNWSVTYNHGTTTYISRSDNWFGTNQVTVDGQIMLGAGVTIKASSYAPLGDYTLSLITGNCNKSWNVHVIANLSLKKDFLKAGSTTISASSNGKYYVNLDSYSSLTWQASANAGSYDSRGINYSITSSNNILSNAGVIDTTQTSGTATITASAYDINGGNLVTVSWEIVFEIDSSDYAISANSTYTYEYNNLSPVKYITVSHGSEVSGVNAVIVGGGDNTISLTQQASNSFKFAINCSRNPTHGNSYSRQFKFTASDSRGINSTITITVIITHSCEYSDYTLSVSPSTASTFSKDGGTQTFTVTCGYIHDGNWTDVNDWSISESPSNSPFIGTKVGGTTNKFTISIGSYTGSDDRTATFTISTTLSGVSSVSIPVIQSGVIYDNYIFNVTPSSASIPPNGNEGSPVILTVECSHTEDGVLVNDSWTVAKSSGDSAFEFTKNANGTVSIEVDANAADDDREITLEFSASGHSSIYATITQEGLAESFSSSNVSLNWDDTSSSVDISSQGDWTITPNDNYDWITISPMSGSGNGTISISTDLNVDDNHDEDDAYYDNTDSRTATFTTGTGKTLTVVQAGHTWTPYFNADDVLVQCNVTSATISIRSDYKWTASVVSRQSTIGNPSIDSQTTTGGQNNKQTNSSTCIVSFDINTDEINPKVVKIKFSPDGEEVSEANDVVVTITQAVATYSINTSMSTFTWNALKNYGAELTVTSSMGGWYISSITYNPSDTSGLTVKTSSGSSVLIGSNYEQSEGTTSIRIEWTAWTDTQNERTAEITFVNANKPSVSTKVQITQNAAEIYIVHVLDSNLNNEDDLAMLKAEIDSPTTAGVESVSWGSTISKQGGTFNISLYVSPGEDQDALRTVVYSIDKNGHYSSATPGIRSLLSYRRFSLSSDTDKFGYLLTVTIDENRTVNPKKYSVTCTYTGDDNLYKEIIFEQEASSYNADFKIYGRLGTYNNVDNAYSIPVQGGQYILTLQNTVPADTEDYLVVESIEFSDDLPENTDELDTVSSCGNIVADPAKSIFDSSIGLKAGDNCNLTVTIYTYHTPEIDEITPSLDALAANKRAFGLTITGHSKSVPDNHLTVNYILPQSGSTETEKYYYSVQTSSPVSEEYRGILNASAAEADTDGHLCYCFSNLDSLNNVSSVVISKDTGDILDSSTSNDYTYYNVVHIPSGDNVVRSIPFVEVINDEPGYLLLDDRFTLIDPNYRYERPQL